MIKMVSVNKKSVAFCKYTVAALLWLAVIFMSVIPVYLVLFLMIISALTGVDKAPLVRLFDLTFARYSNSEKEYINMHSMRFAHIVAANFCIVALLSYYLFSPLLALTLIIILAIMQTIAAFGYCSAQKLYDCVICNSNCCRFGKKIRSIKK